MLCIGHCIVILVDTYRVFNSDKPVNTSYYVTIKTLHSEQGTDY
jgi:hypothetical protein